jgi:hypothetical protein
VHHPCKRAASAHLKHVSIVEFVAPRIEVEQRSLLFWELYRIILREGSDMFRKWLARLIPKRRRSRLRAKQATEAITHELPYDTGLGGVYYAHAAIHGANQLLPRETLPDPPERP